MIADRCFTKNQERILRSISDSTLKISVKLRKTIRIMITFYFLINIEDWKKIQNFVNLYAKDYKRIQEFSQEKIDLAAVAPIPAAVATVGASGLATSPTAKTPATFV